MAQKTNRKPILALLALCLMYGCFTGLVFNTITLYMVPMMEEFAVSRTAVYLGITIMSLVSAVFTLFAFGPIISKLGVRKTLLSAGALVVIAYIVYAVAGSVYIFYVGAAIFGVGIAFLANGTTSLGVNQWFARRQATMISVCTTVGGVCGIIFAPLVGSWIVGMGWRGSFGLTAGITLVLTIVMFILYSDPKPADVKMFEETAQTSDGQPEAKDEGAASKASEETGPAFRGIFTTAQFWLLMVSYLFIGIIFYSLMGNMAIFSADHGLDAVQQGTVLSVVFAATAIAMIPGGALADKLGTKGLLTICCIADIAACIILTQSFQDVVPLYVAAVLIGIGYVAVNVPVAVSVREGLGTKDYAKKMSPVIGLMLLGVAFGPTIMQVVYDATGSYNTVFIMYAIVLVIVAIVMFPATKLAKIKD